MIHFFARQRDTLEKFATWWASELRPRIRTISYNWLPFLKSLPPGACIFADFERLRRWKFSRSAKLSDRLRQEPVKRAVLNDPNRYLNRFELLKTLHARGINDFQACRVDDIPDSLRFPVFLRSAVDHRGAISELLHSRDEIDRALRRLSLGNRFRRKHLMIVEYSHCADRDGLFRKYSVMNIHGTLVPRHVLFSRDWVTKKPDLVSDATVAEEIEFARQLPGRDALAEIFRIAGVDYGRIDYGMKDGRIQVWEINTNPVVVPRPNTIDPKRLPSQTESALRIKELLLELAG
jgi:hypothetical protein